MIKKNSIIGWASLIILSIVYYLYVYKSSISSDQAAFFLEAKDLASGNITLNGWNLSTVNFYFTEMVPFAIAIRMLGSHTNLLYLLPAVYYSIVILISLALTKKNGYGFLVLAIFLMPSKFLAPALISACFHIGALIVGLYTLHALNQKTSTLKYSIILILNALALFSDNLFFYFITAPIFVIFIISLTLLKEKNNYHWLGIVIIPIVISGAIKLLVSYIPHFDIGGINPPEFVTFDGIAHNLYLFSYGTIKAFGADFFGKPISDLLNLKNFVRFACIISIVIFAYKYINKNWRSYFLDRVLVASFALLCTAFLLSNMPIDMASTRYLIPAYFTIFIFIGRNMDINHKSIYLVIIPSLVIMALNFTDWKQTYRDSSYVKVAKFLDKNNLGSGYGSFWHATSIAIHTKNDINIGGTLIDTPKLRLKPYAWLSRQDWYSVKSSYYIAKDESEVKSMAEIFGNDFKIENISGVLIMLYPDKRIFTNGEVKPL